MLHIWPVASCCHISEEQDPASWVIAGVRIVSSSQDMLASLLLGSVQADRHPPVPVCKDCKLVISAITGVEG